ncbi:MULTISPECIES: pitrilysin family protein [unclassified Crossiella]|uniref:M16 family metallopeptidase n=1 Tax=unclassified Crossiella TaxID=2620835 RepID=UPI001FFE9D85|nr:MULTISPECIES: pitrilysin family protein [unclassified Crossiella]MCK2237341.1 insulinase family protein [Crossiella sp. S99.2]MCK2250996.1 insulinase family protein [Crossiella sp. S99.1]
MTESTVTEGLKRRPRTAEEIGRTEQGPRPLPPLGEQNVATEVSIVDKTLANGLRVVAAQRATVPLVGMRLFVPFAGTDPQHPAIAELLAATVTTGTGRRNRLQIADELALVGSSISATVDPERLSFSGEGLASGLDVQLDVLGDLLTGASYPEDELLRERERLVNAIALARSEPGTIAREALQKHRYGDHPFVKEVPLHSDVAEVSAEQVRALHKNNLLPRGSILVLVGDVDPHKMIEVVADKLGGWQGEGSATPLPALPELTGGDLKLVHRPGAVQSQFRLSTQAVPRNHPKYAALQLANLVYCGYFSSRLVENIREDKGFTYSARSAFEYTPGNATLLLDADTASDVSAAALLEIRYELGRMVVSPPTQAEVDSARNYLIGMQLIAEASQAGLANTLLSLTAFGLDFDWLRAHQRRLAQVSVEEVAEAAREFFAPGAWTGVVVGDADALAGTMGALGGVLLP